MIFRSNNETTAFAPVIKENDIVAPTRSLTSSITARTLCLLASLVAMIAMALSTDAKADPNAPWEISHFSSLTTDQNEFDYDVAGGHPFQNFTVFKFPVWRNGFWEEARDNFKDAQVNLPLGFFGNPSAFPRCPGLPAFFNPSSACPPSSAVGIGGPVTIFRGNYPLFSVKPDFGTPAQFAFRAGAAEGSGEVIIIKASLRPRSEGYGLTVGIRDTTRVALTNVETTFCSFGTSNQGRCASPAGHTGAPFLTNSVDCSEAAPIWEIAADSWENPGRKILNGLPDQGGTPDLSDPNWLHETFPASPVTGCENLVFAPSFETKPLQGPGPAQADQPSGLAVDLDFPQNNDPTDLSTTFDVSLPQTPSPKDITVKLPAGLAISPPSADGLGACSDQASDPVGDQVHYDNTKPVKCPDSSKIGSAVAVSPLLATRDAVTDEVNGAEPILGDVYLLKPHPGDLVNGEDGKFRLLIQLEHARYGINFKLPGVAVADKVTGQLTTVFTQNPQLPAKHLTVNLKSGPRAPLMTPVTCGKFTSTSDMTPWGTPTVPNATPSASFDVSSGPNGTACPSTAAARPFSPTLSAGTESSKAGASSPFVLKLSRNDGDQEMSSIEVTTPPGFTAKLKGVASCSDTAIDAAKGKSGAAEQASASCPSSSQVGTTATGAGPGTNPLYTPGKAYLAGPYKGAPLSFVFITPAVAGPFDLGNVVIRAGAYLDPATAQVTVKTDQLPQMLNGIPLRLRSVTTQLDRADFTLNPTDCNAMSVSASVNSSDGATANSTTPFQVGNCQDLGFKPNLKLALKGKVSRRSHPSLQAHLTARPGDANIARAQVKLPKAAFLDNAHIGQVCTRVQFAADQCPEASIYGFASATTPLLDYPLTGNVYLRSSSNKLPDLVVGFNGPSSQPIEIELSGKTDSVKGALRNTFEAVPDVPVTDFHLTLFGGKRGLIIMSSGFCADPRASFKFDGQNGMEYDTTPKVAAKCPKKKGKKKGK